MTRHQKMGTWCAIMGANIALAGCLGATEANVFWAVMILAAGWSSARWFATSLPIRSHGDTCP